MPCKKIKVQKNNKKLVKNYRMKIKCHKRKIWNKTFRFDLSRSNYRINY